MSVARVRTYLRAGAITYRDNLDVGIKFAVHDQDRLPLLSVTGMSAPPGSKALAAVSVRDVRRHAGTDAVE